MSAPTNEAEWYDLAATTAQKMLTAVEPDKSMRDLRDDARCAIEEAAESVVELWFGPPPQVVAANALMAERHRTAYRLPNGKGKAHGMGQWVESTSGGITPQGGYCGAMFFGHEPLPLVDVPVADRCKVCWPTTPAPRDAHEPAAGSAAGGEA